MLLHLIVSPSFRAKNWTLNFFFSNFLGTAGISQQNPGISHQKGLISLVLRDIPNFLAPTPSHGRPPPHPKISGPKSLRLGSFFFPENSQAVLDGVPPTGVATLKVRKGASHALNKGPGALLATPKPSHNKPSHPPCPVLGNFSVRGIPSFCPSNSEARACNPCFEAQKRF